MSADRRKDDRRQGPPDRRQGDRRENSKKTLTVNLSVFITVLVIIAIIFTIFSKIMLHKIKNLENNGGVIVLPSVDEYGNIIEDDTVFYDTDVEQNTYDNTDLETPTNNDTVSTSDNNEIENISNDEIIESNTENE